MSPLLHRPPREETRQESAGAIPSAGEDALRLAIDTIPDLVWTSQADGHIEYLNKRWLDFTGMRQKEATGWGWQAAIHPDDLPRLDAYWRSRLEAGAPGEYEARLRRFDGEYRWFLFRSVPLHDEQGTLVKWYGTNTDIDERRASEHLSRGQFDALTRLLEVLADESDPDQLPRHVVSTILTLLDAFSVTIWERNGDSFDLVGVTDEGVYRTRNEAGHLEGSIPALDGAPPLWAEALGGGERAPFLTLGGEVRFRYELLANDNFGDGPQDAGGYILTRYMPYASLVVPNLPGDAELELFGQVEAAFSDGDARGPGPIDQDEFDFIQAFAKFTIPLGNGTLMVQGGRQEISFGTERLLSTRYGPNLPLSFDGGFLRWKDATWEIHAFYLRPVQIAPDPLDNLSSERQQLWGLYASRSLEKLGPLFTGTNVDLYYFGYFDADAAYASGSGRELRHTLGTRFFGHRDVPGGTFDWNYEAMLQFGRFDSQRGNGSILAWSAGTETGYMLDAPFTPRLSLRANVISGDLHANDANLQTFNPLYPKGKYFGELTPVGPYNLINALGALGVAPTPETSLSVQGGPYWRYSPADGVYGVGGNLVRGPGDSDARFIGTQLEFVGEWHPVRELAFLVSYSLFGPGAFIRETGPAETIHFFAVEAVVQF